jgi:hypothetical protein
MIERADDIIVGFFVAGIWSLLQQAQLIWTGLTRILPATGDV